MKMQGNCLETGQEGVLRNHEAIKSPLTTTYALHSTSAVETASLHSLRSNL